MQSDVVDEADADLNSGLAAAAASTDVAINSKLEMLDTSIANLRSTRDEELESSQASFYANVQDIAYASQSQLNLNESLFDGMAETAVLGTISDVASDSTSLENLDASLAGHASIMAGAVATAEDQFNTTVKQANKLWEDRIAEASGAYAESVFDEGNEYGNALNVAGNQFEEDVAQAYAVLTDGINAILEPLANNIQLIRDVYLGVIQAKKAEFEERIATIIQQKRSDLLDVMQTFYQRQAEFVEQTIDEADMRDAVKTAALGIIDQREIAHDEVTAVLNEFVEEEQTAMVTMVTAVAVLQNTALNDVADQLSSYHDSLANHERTALDAASDAMATYDAVTTDERAEFANAFQGLDSSYRLALYNAAVAHQTTVYGAVRTYATDSIATASTWLGMQGYSSFASTTANVATVINEHVQRRNLDYAVEQNYLTQSTAEENIKAERDYSAEQSYAQAATTAVAATSHGVNGDLNDYALEGNRLQREWVTKANSKDVETATAVAEGVKARNLEIQPTGDGNQTQGAIYRADLMAEDVANWPTSLGLPAVFSGQEHIIDLVLMRGSIDIAAVEAVFSGYENVELLENDVEADPQPATGEKFTGAVQSSPAPIEAPKKYHPGEVVRDGTDDEVGIIVIEADGSVWVQRTITKSYTPSTAYPEGVGEFDFRVPLGSVESYLNPAVTAPNWDLYFGTYGMSVEFNRAVEAGSGSIYERFESFSDVATGWLNEILVGSASGSVDTVINSVDSFFAGMASTITGGLTDKVRIAVYGDIAKNNQEGPFYTAGQIAGIAPAIAVGIMSGGTSAHVGIAIQFSRTLTAVQTAQGFYDSGKKVLEGQPLDWTDALNFAPALTAGTSRAFKWVQCFEGNTPVAVDWIPVASDDPRPALSADEVIEPESDSAGVFLVSDSWEWFTILVGVLWLGTELSLSKRRSTCKRQIPMQFFTRHDFVIG